MGVRTKARASYADIEALPEHEVGEIIGGDLFVSPLLPPRPSYTKSVLGAEIVSRCDLRGGTWVILDGPELHAGDDVLVPDIAGWRRSRMPSLPDEPYFTLTPDWACEVLSPSTLRHDRARKMAVYAREGVPHLWLVDPMLQLLEVYRLAGGHWLLLVTHDGDAKVRAEPFDAIELDLALLWE